jgi:hypothetical protein
MGAGYGKTRCCVEYCDGVGAIPVELLSRLHVLLCTLHAREWGSQHAPTSVRTAEAHVRWRAWLKEASHRAWLLQTSQRQQLERALAERRAHLREAELRKFREELESAVRAQERTITATYPGWVGSRALRKMAGAIRRAVWGGEPTPSRSVGRLAGAMPRRR